jgi:hypothetical protein
MSFPSPLFRCFRQDTVVSFAKKHSKAKNNDKNHTLEKFRYFSRFGNRFGIGNRYKPVLSTPVRPGLNVHLKVEAQLRLAEDLDRRQT